MLICIAPRVSKRGHSSVSNAKSAARMHAPTALVAGVLLSGLCMSVAAQTSVGSQGTDAGRVYDSLQKRGPQTQPAILPDVKLQPNVTAPNDTLGAATQLEVKQFRIEGVTLLAQPRLDQVVKPFAGRTLSVAQLQEAADAVAQTYREAGYLFVQALVLPQSITDGVVTITVREGRIEKLDTASTPAGKSLPGVVQSGLEKNIRSGETLSTPALEETLLLVNDLPGQGRTTAEIAPGTQADTANIKVNYTPAARVGGVVQADNTGGRYTGRNRLLGQIYVNDPLGIADQASLTVLTTGKLLSFAQLGYRAPLGLRTSVGVSASTLKYDVCCLAAGQSSSGTADSLGLDVAYNVRMQRGSQFALTAAADTKKLATDANGAEQTRRKVQGLSLGARGYWTDSAYNGWSASWRTGRVDLATNPADLAADEVGARVQGRFSKLNASAYRNQAFSNGWSWQVSLRGQANLGRNLESSERFSLGGADGVRAYPSGEGVGETGWLAAVDVRYALAAVQGLSLTGFVDTGGIKRFSKNAVLLAGATPNSYQLSGAGLGLRYETTAVTLLLTVAKPIGQNRGLDAAGNNNEGRSDGTQAWVSAAWRF
jgi:hemolysin activation/secretion protein